MNRKLALKREVLTELTETDLRGLAGGQGGTDTCASCLTWVSCYMTDCMRPTLELDCFIVQSTEIGC